MPTPTHAHMTRPVTQEERTGFLFCDLDSEIASVIRRERQRMALHRITAPKHSAPASRWWGIRK